ncbi:MAG: hypothetical protein HY698_01755 [Deltaproteobacteria bacterium]|nr:hypothetical protein [Deltaproteobacteria bacterium]
MRAVGALVPLGLVLSCVSPDGPRFPYKPMCDQSTPCDSGEACDQGICFGNPPALTFAAELFPPPGYPELARTEIPRLDIAQDGTVSNLHFAKTVRVTGRVVLASDTRISVAATITFRRPSRIPGASDTLVTVTSLPGVDEKGIAFKVFLVPTDPTNPDDRYEITVYPAPVAYMAIGEGVERLDAQPAPLRLISSIAVEESNVTFTLGQRSDMRSIRGRVVGSLGEGLSGFEVRAIGRFLAKGPAELASSVVSTDRDGRFALGVPKNWQDQFDVLVQPKQPGQPTLVRRNVSIAELPESKVLDLGELRMPSYPAPVTVDVDLVGRSNSGGMQVVAGSFVTFRTILAESPDLVFFDSTATASTSGHITLPLIPASALGSRKYAIDVQSPPGTPHESLWAHEIEVGPSGGILEPIVLPSRAYLTGRVLEFSGTPALGMTVGAHPSLLFEKLSVASPSDRSRLASMAWPEASTDASGRFGIYLDRKLMGIPTSYDLELIPPAGSLLSRSSRDNISLESVQQANAAVDLGNVSLPDAAYSRGAVLDESGRAVPDAEVRVFVVPEDGGICDTSSAPDCKQPVKMRALTRSDETGNVLLVLPRLDFGRAFR